MSNRIKFENDLDLSCCNKIKLNILLSDTKNFDCELYLYYLSTKLEIPIHNLNIQFKNGKNIDITDEKYKKWASYIVLETFPDNFVIDKNDIELLKKFECNEEYITSLLSEQATSTSNLTETEAKSLGVIIRYIFYLFFYEKDISDNYIKQIIDRLYNTELEQNIKEIYEQFDNNFRDYMCKNINNDIIKYTDLGSSFGRYKYKSKSVCTIINNPYISEANINEFNEFGSGFSIMKNILKILIDKKVYEKEHIKELIETLKIFLSNENKIKDNYNNKKDVLTQNKILKFIDNYNKIDDIVKLKNYTDKDIQTYLFNNGVSVSILIEDISNILGVGSVYVKARNLDPSFINGYDDVNGVITGTVERIVSQDKNNIDKILINCPVIGPYGPYTGVFVQKDDLSINDLMKEQNKITNKNIYDKIGSIITNMFESSYNILSLSYGLSGSGKTFSLFGDIEKNIEKHGNNWSGELGITQYMLEDVFKKTSSVKMFSFQLYKGSIYKTVTDNDIKCYRFRECENTKCVLDINTGISDIKLESDYLSDYLKLKGKNILSIADITKEFFDNMIYHYWDKTKTKTDHQNYKNDISDKISIKRNHISSKTELFDKLNDLSITDLYSTGLKGTETRAAASKEIVDTVIYLNSLLRYYRMSSEIFDYEWLSKNSMDTSSLADDNNYIQISSVEDFNSKLITKIVRNRLTRGTLSNKDSSRSHLFIIFKILYNDKEYNITVSDLAGAEKPDEYIGEAAKEGYYVIDSLYQLKQLIKNYNNTFNIGNIEPLKGTPVPYYTYISSKSSNITIKDKFENNDEEKAIKNMKEVISYVLGLSTKKNTGISKILTFINTKTFKPKSEANKVNICNATSDTLKYGMELLGLPINLLNTSFGHLKRKNANKKKRSYTKKTKKSAKKRSTKKRSAKKINRSTKKN